MVKKYKYKPKDKVYNDGYEDIDEEDFWRDKFGDEKKAICEICNLKVIHKNKSPHSFSLSPDGIITLKCNNCFCKVLDKDNTIKDIEENIETTNNPTDPDEYMDNIPNRFDLWKKQYGNKKYGRCAICDYKFGKYESFVWYIIHPKEGGLETLDNSQLVCEDCKLDMINEDRGITSFYIAHHLKGL